MARGGGKTVMEEIRHGRPLAVDNKAKSASPTEPAFVARPEGASVYHGFVVLDDVTGDGFTLGQITDWKAAAGSAMGGIGLLVFALSFWQFAPRHRPCAVLTCAAVAWFTVSVLLWQVRKRI
jgi:hypothetical protein